MREKRSVVCILSLLLILSWVIQAVAVEKPVMRIGKISVENNRRIEADTILDKVKTKPGDPFDPKALRNDLTSIFATGFFNDVKIDSYVQEGKLKVTFLVDEKPFIREIEIEGNEGLDTDDIMNKLTLKTNSIYNRKIVAENAELIRNYYMEEGWYLAEVSYDVETISEDWIKLIYQIEEGLEVRIEKIEFEGNVAFDDDELADQMETVEYWWLSWLTGSGHLEKEEFDLDIERLLDFYYNRGYLKVVIETPDIKISDNKENMYITIPVTEGDQYKVGKVSLDGNRIFSDEKIFERVETKTGEVFDRSLLSQDIMLITDKYASQGYLLTDVYPVVTTNDIEKTADIIVKINEGNIVYTNMINISGNEDTIDKVIRREVRVLEGDVLTSTAIKRTEERLNRLGFFETAELKTSATDSEDALDLDINVKERLTGSFSIGAGWSSVDKIVGTVKLTKANLFGRGQKISLETTLGGKSQSVVFSFFEPYVFDSHASGGFDVFYKIRKGSRYIPYDTQRVGFSLPFSYPLAEYWRIYNTYRYQNITVFDVDDDASEEIIERYGDEVTSSDAVALVRDSRDSRFLPTRGSKNKVSVEYAGGVLGGNQYFIKYYVQSSWFYTPFWKIVANVSGRGGYIQSYNDRSVPLEELYTLGGPHTIRGFSPGQIGPKSGDTVVGGNKYLVFNLEFFIPIVDVLGIGIFADTGNAWNSKQDYYLDDMRSAAGAGFRMFTPIGPVKLDWGYKLDRKEGEDAYEWHFSMGSYF